MGKKMSKELQIVPTIAAPELTAPIDDHRQYIFQVAPVIESVTDAVTEINRKLAVIYAHLGASLWMMKSQLTPAEFQALLIEAKITRKIAYNARTIFAHSGKLKKIETLSVHEAMEQISRKWDEEEEPNAIGFDGCKVPEPEPEEEEGRFIHVSPVGDMNNAQTIQLPEPEPKPEPTLHILHKPKPKPEEDFDEDEFDPDAYVEEEEEEEPEKEEDYTYYTTHNMAGSCSVKKLNIQNYPSTFCRQSFSEAQHKVIGLMAKRLIEDMQSISFIGSAVDYDAYEASSPVDNKYDPASLDSFSDPKQAALRALEILEEEIAKARKQLE